MILIDDILKVKGSLKNFKNTNNKKYNRVSINSLDVKKGEIFFAIKGENNDGHKYIDDVIKKKAGLIFVNNSWYNKNKKEHKDNVFYVVKDTTIALGELAHHHKNRMGIPILGVAGSNGKTTTKDIISSVLSSKLKVLKTEGNFNNHIGLPLTLLRIQDTHNFCVAELGSNHFKELDYLCKIAEPDFGLITNIGKEHLEFFKNIKGVAKEEFTLFDYVGNNGSVCFYNLDDAIIKNYKETHNYSSFTYSYKYTSDVKGNNLGYDKKFSPLIEYKFRGKKYKVRVNTFGKHSFYNGLAAIAVGLYFGVNPKHISNTLSNLESISQKRMEYFECSGIKVINDTYNSNPCSVKLGLETVKDFFTKGKKHIVISDMLEMGNNSKKEHYEIGKLINRNKFDFVYTYGEMSYHTFKGCKGMKNNFYFEDKEDLAVFVKHNLAKDDIVYFKGSRGMNMEEVVNKVFKNKNISK